MQPIFDNDANTEHHWTFTIDKPIDLRLINPSEKVIYNPEEANIEMTGTYSGHPLVFPSGYTFRTIHGIHPTEAAVLAADPQGVYPNPLLAPVPSTLGVNSSVYRVKSGNILLIEPCVTIMDAEIIVETGATLTYDEDFTYGNFTVTNLGGTVEPLSAAPPVKPCIAECFIEGYNDVVDLDISTTQTWSPGAIPDDANSDDVLRIAGLVRVRSGGVLTLNGIELQFGPYGRMIVERGGRVLAYNTIFTSACENMWAGVEVWGTRDAAQLPLIGNPDQGIFSAYECDFENAREALAATRFDDPSGIYGGGVISVQHCVFRNNARDAYVAPTRNMIGGVEAANVSKFLNNQFICDRQLTDPAYSDGYGERRAPREHIRLVGVKRVLIHQNTFSNSLPGSAQWLPHFRGAGVFSLGSDFTASNNTFTGFSEAIWHARGWKPLPSARIRNNAITGCIHGIVLVGSDNDEVVGNTIELPPSPAFGYADDDPDQGYDHPVGIYTQQALRFHLEGNTITGAAGSAADPYFTYGLVLNQSNTNDPGATALAYLNTVNDVNVAIQCEGDNRGDFVPGEGSGLMI